MKIIKCLKCGKENSEQSQVCSECGVDLKIFSSNQQNGNSSRLTSSQEVNASTELVENLPDQVHAILVIERGFAVGKKFYLTADESHIGRWDADNGIFPDVDLDPYDPEAKVSRKHARIILENGVYMIEDLGSTNGTFINRGKRLKPGVKELLEDGDEIIIGKTFLRFYIRHRKGLEKEQ